MGREGEGNLKEKERGKGGKEKGLQGRRPNFVGKTLPLRCKEGREDDGRQEDRKTERKEVSTTTGVGERKRRKEERYEEYKGRTTTGRFLFRATV